MKKIVFLGGKEIGYDCLKHLLENSGKHRTHVAAAWLNERKILSTSQPSLKNLCAEFSVPVISSVEEILKIDFDILVSVQFHEILKKEILRKAKQIAVNLHMAPLPEYRGCNQFSFAIIDGAKEFGTTFHRMEEKIDAGDILFEKRFPIAENITVQQLYEKTLSESVKLFKENIGQIISGEFSLTPQKNLTGKRKSSFHLRSDIEKIKQIDLNWEKQKILRHFHATYFPPFPPPFAIANGKKIEITPEWIKENL